MSLLPQYLSFGEDEDNKEIELLDRLFEITDRVNKKDSGIHETVETPTFQSWFNPEDYQSRRDVYRKVILFPSLTAAGTTSVAHGLGDVSGYTFSKICGTARNTAGTLHAALPQGGLDDVMITVNANNVNIICRTATYNTFAALVVLEYLKN